MAIKQSSVISQPRYIRVFVSSTFRDMQAERDELVKFIFPQLRKLCEQRGVIWGEVDLRWGISNEQKSEGKVLPICLDEIQRCKPYFIGVLGERYGWVPDEISSELVEREPWLAEHFDNSVTELEILHGVLNDQAMTKHAYFYFRDPNYLDTILDDRSDYEEVASSISKQKLLVLKDQIRKSGFPVIENYPTPKEFGELVLRDLTALISELYPEGSKLNALDQEAFAHEIFAQSRAQVYIGGKTYFDQLDAYVNADTQPLVILGESGSGKSALLANWVFFHRATHPEDLVLMHFIGATPESADWISMLQRILGEFKEKLNLQFEIPNQPDALRKAFANGLAMASAKGQIILVLDALDQLTDQDGALDLVWLPTHIPENVRMIFSTLPGCSLNELKQRGISSLTIEPLIVEERKQLIKEYLALFTKALDPAPTERIANAVQCQNPLFLRVLLDELRQFGKHERLGDQIELYLNAATLPALYEIILHRCEQDYEQERPGLVGDAMSLLWAARRGLSESELMELLGFKGRPMPHAYWSPLFLSLELSFLNRNGYIGFFHNHLRQAIQNRYLKDSSSQRSAHLQLAAYFAAQIDQPPRKLDELPWQLTKVGDWRSLNTLLKDQPFLQAACQANFIDVKKYWAQIEANSNYRMLDTYQNILKQPDLNRAYLWFVSLLLGDTGNLEEALFLHTYMVEYCRKTDNKENLQISLGNLANILSDRGEFENAITLYREQESLCREMGEQDGLQASISNQANILFLQGNLDKAMSLYKESERICRIMGNQHGLQTSLGNQANILYSRGDLNGAFELLKNKERICRELGNIDGLIGSLGNRAVLLKDNGDLDASMSLLKEVECLARDLGDKDSLQACYGNQGLILYSNGDQDGAMQLYKKQERICRELGNRTGLVNSLGNQALVLEDQGDLIGAMALHKEEECICREINNQNGLQRSLGNQANLLFARNDLDGAMALRLEQEQICRRSGYMSDLQVTLGHQAKILSTRGESEKALALYREQERICVEINNKTGIRGSFGNQAQILFARGDLDGALKLHKQEEALCRELIHMDELLSSLGNQARIYASLGDLNRAMSLLKEVEQISRDNGNIDGLQLSLSQQANILFSQNNLDEALKLLNQVVSLCRQSRNETLLVNTIGNQALILKTRGDMDGAMLLFKEQEDVFRKNGNQEGLQLALDNQANILYSRGDLMNAMISYKEQEQISRELGNSYSLATSLLNQIMILARSGKKTEAHHLVEECTRIAKNKNYTPIISRIMSIRIKYGL